MSVAIYITIIAIIISIIALVIVIIQIPGEQGPAGPQGEQGPAGPQGEQGPAGADGAPGSVNTYVRIARSEAVSPGGITTQTVSCDSGDIVTGGGHEPTNFDSLSSSNPILTDPLTTWKGSMKYIGTSGTAFLTVFVVCADITP